MKENEQRIRLFEQRNDVVIDTLFDGDGAILMQQIVKNERPLNSIAYDIMRENNILSARETNYTKVRLNKKCPKCDDEGLLRYMDAFSSKNELPIMPLYYCNKCSTKSYHLTDNYLKFLVEKNNGLFSSGEILEMNSDRNGFLEELRSYIIRIFASKRIMCIK